MSANDQTKFEIEVTDDVTLARNSTVFHAEHGPMDVDQIRVGAMHKTVVLQSATGPIGLKLSAEDLREQWGETLAEDPAHLFDTGTTRFTNEGVTVDGGDVEVDITVSGPESAAEKVHVHALDQIVRAMQAVRDEDVPEECDGVGYSIDWSEVCDEVDG